ncbi:hypothetical protein [Mycobacterium sp. NPDC050853]|uniref:hypothetical protein n=1 Tax=Mycobacterium sp. NPDC050853 TaxID=3155160 RepID=UPI0033D9FC54
MDQLSLAEAVKQGQVQGLTALRDLLATEIDGCDDPKTLPALSKQFTDVLAALAALAPAKKSRIDELAEQRRKRRAGTGRAASSD